MIMPARVASRASSISDNQLSLIVVVFFCSFLFPVVINLGPVKFLPYRLVLLFVAVPVAYQFFTTTKKLFVDYLLITYVLWCSLCIVVWFGLISSIESIAIYWIETLIPYFMARLYITNAQKLVAFAKFMLLIILILIPIGIFENFTATSLPITIFGKVLSTIPYVHHEMRLGLDRAQGPFDHPILLGVFCFTFFSIVFYLSAPEKKLFTRITNAALVFVAGFTSLSSGPLAGMAAQLGLILWGAAFKSVPARWIILLSGLATMYLTISIFANSSPIEIAFRYLTFNSNTAWARINIWNFGYASMLDYPIFGHGPNEWTRPSWLGASIDMYWLVPGVRYGFPGFFLNLAVFASAFYAVANRKCKNDLLNICSRAYLFSLIGLLVAGWSVHFWNATYVSYMFVLGIGLWLASADEESEPAEVEKAEARSPRMRRQRTRAQSRASFSRRRT